MTGIWFIPLPSAAIMMTSSNGNIFRVTGPLCGEFTGHRWIPLQRPVTRSFGASFDLCLNKRLSKQSWGWWFETPSHPLWRHCYDDLRCAGFEWFIFQPCVFRIGQWPPMLGIGRWTWNIFGQLGPVHRGFVPGGTQCWPELWNKHIYVNPHDQKYLFIFLFLYWISVARLSNYVMSCWQ